MKTKTLEIIVSVIVICVLVAAFLVEASLTPHPRMAKPLDFTVSGSNPCLRFLNSSVSTVYVPFTIGANQNWQLTINCTKMPGGASGWTDIYIYKGYWDKGTNYECNA